MLVMSLRFIPCDRDQSFLMPPDLREWLPENHLAWFVLEAVEEMDLWPFYAAHRVDGKSRPAYEPAMMVALLLYAYARGIRSSRLIERACVEDVACRVVAAQQRPDHATLARFVVGHQHALGCWRCAPTPGWPRSGSWRSMAPRSRPTPTATARSTTSSRPS